MKKASIIWAAAGMALMAQGPAAGPNMQVIQLSSDVHVRSAAEGPQAFHFVASDVLQAAKVVTGKPYAAESVTETVQVLGDGTRITRTNSAKMYRDKEGRTRREQTIQALAPNAPTSTRTVITIHDPVAGVDYVLDPETKTARRITVAREFKEVLNGEAKVYSRGEMPAELKDVLKKVEAGEAGPNKRVMVYQNSQSSDVLVRNGNGPVTIPDGASPSFNVTIPDAAGPARRVEIVRTGDVNKEELGKRTIEGLACDGTRTSMTTPIGAIGNDRPIVAITEVWFSPDLETIVSSKTSDPRFGETTYTLRGISRADQPANLFQPPADYTVKDGGSSVFKIRRDVKTN